MGRIYLSGFGGIAPRFEGTLKPGMAAAALDCDLSARTIAPRRSDLIVTALAGSYDSIVKFGGSWLGGNGACFFPWTIDGTDLLIYLDGGTLKRRIGSVTVDLGQAVPGVPTAAAGGSGSLTGSYFYMVTFTREVGGYQDESGPSSPSTVTTVSSKEIVVTCPATTDPYVLYWNLYRLSTSTGEYLLVSQVPITTPIYTDDTEDADLGIACPTWYTSSQGNEIIVGSPPTGLDGLASDLYAGMLLAWKGNRLYFCEPGTPDFWPGIYWIDFRTDIIQVLPFAGSVAVLCKDGPYRVDGTHPELMQQSRPLGKEPCMAATSCQSNIGVNYLSDSGIVLFNLVNTTVFSIGAFTEEWFAENIGYAAAKLAVVNDKLILFHSGGALCYDETIKQWFTLSTTIEAVWADPEDGDLYYLSEGSIKSLFGSDTLSAYTWKTGPLYGSSPFNDNTWITITPVGTGSMTLTAWVDGIQVVSSLFDMDSKMERDQVIKFPESCVGRKLELQVYGTGEIQSMLVEYQ